jgi:hypothetical protein
MRVLITGAAGIWNAGYAHGQKDEHASEHGKDPLPLEHTHDICPRCASGNDTTQYWDSRKDNK